MKKNMKKLVLNKETVRTLQDSELKAVVGGRNAVQRVLAKARVDNVVHSYYCPCPSTSTTGGDLQLV